MIGSTSKLHLYDFQAFENNVPKLANIRRENYYIIINIIHKTVDTIKKKTSLEIHQVIISRSDDSFFLFFGFPIDIFIGKLHLVRDDMQQLNSH